MKTLGVILKLVAAIAAVAGAIYAIATYGDQIVAWAKQMMEKCPCKCCGKDEETCCCESAENKADESCTCAPAEEAAPAPEVPVEEAPAPEAPAEETTPAAEEVPAEETTPAAEEVPAEEASVEAPVAEEEDAPVADESEFVD